LATPTRQTAPFLWKDPKNMHLSQFEGPSGFVLSGECPHCHGKAAFPSVTQVFFESSVHSVNNDVAVAACRCIGCNKYICGILQQEYMGGNRYQWKYFAHYPLGVPDDTVAEEIPDEIKPDFREALRCRFVNAYNATIEMCRRALEASCLQLGAKSSVVLSEMIDWVHSQGKITTPLKDMAHKIKLGGNRAAHPSDRTLTPEDADAVIEFTDEYFHHVYVMPARMKKRNFDKPDKKKP
jgi:hypothetical protein